VKRDTGCEVRVMRGEKSNPYPPEVRQKMQQADQALIPRSTSVLSGHRKGPGRPIDPFVSHQRFRFASQNGLNRGASDKEVLGQLGQPKGSAHESQQALWSK